MNERKKTCEEVRAGEVVAGVFSRIGKNSYVNMFNGMNQQKKRKII